MRRQRFLLITPIALLIAVWMDSPVNFPAPFPTPQVLAQTPADREAEADRLLKQGIQQYYTSQFEAAIQSWQQALTIYREIKDRSREGAALGILGIAYLSLGDYAKAIEYHQQSLAIARSIKDRSSEGKALGNLGNAYYSLGDYAKAIEYQQQSLAIARSIKDRSGEGNALGNLGSAYDSLGDYAKAIEYQQQSLAIARDIKNSSGEGNALGNLGLAYSNLGDYAKAIEYLQQSLAIARSIKNRSGEGKALGNLGIAYDSLGDYAKAIEYHQQSLAIARSIKNRSGEGKALGNLGIAYRNLGDYAKAIEYHQQSLAIARSIKDRSGEGAALGNLGIAYRNLGDYAKAIEYQQQQLAIAREIKDRSSEGGALNNLGFAYLKSGNLVSAEKKLSNAIEVWESIRKDLGSNDAFKVSIFDTQTAAYLLLQEVLIAQNKPEAALEIAERGRARAFVELLASRLAADSVPDLADKPSGSPINNSSVTSPRTTPVGNPPSVAQIQQIAKEQKATIVEYSIIFNEAIFIWVIQPTGAVAFRQVDLKSLDSSLGDVVEESRVDAALGRGLGQQDTAIADFVRGTREELGVQNRDLTFNLEAAEAATMPLPPTANSPQNPRLVQLHKVLIEPIADLLPADPNAHIIFIPQGSLFSVPFPALLDASGKYLIEKHTILTAPSIQVLDLTHQHARTAAVGSLRSNSGGISPPGVLEALVVGNPTMPSISTEIGEQPAQLAPLPGSEREAKNIAALLNTQPLIGAVATETAVVQQMSGARLIHLATHGLMDDFTGGGLPGAIALAPTSSDDGLLTASEILALKLNADLIVVSACDTGRGRLTGDGVIGLSRSLITAGASSLIVSLWSVPDSPTASLMTEFYRQMSKTGDKALALRLAMLTTMQQHPYPRDWAAFTLIGEAE